MRIRIPRRFLLLGILLCSLALVASVPQHAFAKPIPWDPSDGPSPGDGDGPIVKGSGTSSPKATATMYSSSTAMRNTKAVTTVSSMWKAYLTALRLGYGWRWIW
jgi:hypothetical protein